jgi:hypothetical protein
VPVDADLLAAGGSGGTSGGAAMYIVCLFPALLPCMDRSHRCTGAFANASLVPYCRFSIAFTGAVIDLSVDLPLVKAESPNLGLEPERSRVELGGGGGKFIGDSPRPRVDNGEMTVIALVGVATSLARLEGVRTLVCKRCKCGDTRASNP